MTASRLAAPVAAVRLASRQTLPVAATVFAVAVAAGLGQVACGSATAPGASSAAPTAPAAAPPAKSVQLNAPGAPVDVAAVLPAGYVTVVDFWSQTCEACEKFGSMLDTGVAGEPRVVIRKVDVGDGDTPVATAYQINALPRFLIYDKQKRLRYDLIGPDCADAAKYARQLAAE